MEIDMFSNANNKSDSALKLRAYQEEAVECVMAEWMKVDRTLLVIPTGGGKTIIFSSICSRMPGRTLILCHQNELIDQAVDKLFKSTGIIADKEKAESRASLQSAVVVASVQSMARRLDKFPHDHFDQIICDEAHLAMSAQWQIVLNHFKSKVLGVTATPSRSDGKKLMEFFQSLAYEVKLFDLIKQGYLARISVRTIPIEIDVTKVAMKGGDYDAESLDETLEPYFDAVCAAMKQHAIDRKFLVFLPLVKTSKTFVGACHRAGISAMHIDGSSDDRKEVLNRFSDDEFQVLANASLLTTGYDEPSINCIINLRPTKSRTLYSQCIGRGTRLKLPPRATDLLILDFLWQFEKHIIMGPGHLIAKNDDQAERVRRKFAKGEVMDLEFADTEAAAEAEKELIDKLKKGSSRPKEYFDAIEWAAMAGDRDVLEYEPMTHDEMEPMSKGQEVQLEKAGFILSTVKGKGHADLIVNHLNRRAGNNLCSYKQLHWLRKYNVANAENKTKDEASLILGRIWNKR